MDREPLSDAQDQDPLAEQASAQDQLEIETLIEDVSIDGMCGVY